MSLDMARNKGTTHAIAHDPWDTAALKRAGKEVRALGRARRKLNDFALTGTDAVDDAFFALHKADPHLVDRQLMRPSHLVNRQVIGELLAHPTLRRLREHTVGDLVAAALAAVEIEKTLESIFDRLSVAQGLADKLQVTLNALERAQEATEKAQDALDVVLGEVGEEDMDRALLAAAELRGARAAAVLFGGVAEDVRAGLEAALAEAGPEVAESLGECLGSAANGQAEMSQRARAWGMSEGVLQRMPAAERLALAKSLNTPRMRGIADLFGRIENLSLSVAAEDMPDVHDEVVDLETGSDLSRVVPSEFLMLADPLTEPNFLSRLVDGELLQYSVQGSDDAGRGGIVMCIDGSGSMSIGQREMWAKATMLVLLHQARTQGRAMHIIHFGFRQMVEFSFTRPEDFTADAIVAASEAFWASGTDFQAPMARAVEVLGEQFERTGQTRADVVFATDDECHVPGEFMADYLKSMHAMNARTWGLIVEGDAELGGPLHQMSEGRVLTVSDLTSGRDLRPLLARIR